MHSRLATVSEVFRAALVLQPGLGDHLSPSVEVTEGNNLRGFWSFDSTPNAKSLSSFDSPTLLCLTLISLWASPI
ncbi:hypothetical protein BJY04DRAFT_57202 [Aspergillus karnatakaensis]|uniref:uncharacterized protein n=1 Tax=Aspergillus karnatakaensis TaxID=1810916 RepID=UPI003CCE2F41